MNYLAHLYLAERTGTSFAGNFLGDFVHGRLGGRFAPEIETGIQLHRRIDSYSDSHPLLAETRAWFDPPYRRYAGILLDIYFDHLLARHWQEFHDEPVPRFANRAARLMHQDWPTTAPFPRERLTGLPRVLGSYTRLDGVATALERVDARLSRPSPLPHSLPLLTAHDDALDRVFQAFFPQLVHFSLTESRRLSQAS